MNTTDGSPLTFWIAIIGAIVGAVGMILGIMNTWRAFRSDKLRIKVIPGTSFTKGQDNKLKFIGLSMEVINLSQFAVTITEVGFGYKKGKINCFNEIYGTQLPHRLEPRTSFMVVLSQKTSFHPNMKLMTYAFAQTACGNKFIGDSPAFRDFKKKIPSHPGES